MKYCENILEAIGNTPLVKMNNISKGLKPTILAKVEYLNPGGSIKDRMAIKMIDDAEKKGLLKKGATIIEPTSGNTGCGLALVCALRGYKMIFTMPEKMSKEKEALLKAYGATVVRCPTEASPEDPCSYYKVAERLVKKTPNSFSPNQYHNQSNPQAHYESTGPEIWRDTGGKITHLVAGIGTGGTITGIARYLKEKNPKIKVIAPDPEGSIYHHKIENTEGKIHSYKVEGIGEDFMPTTVDLKLVDKIILTTDKESFDIARKLAREEGLLVGGSSGSAMSAALKTAEHLDENAVIVVILPDTGRNYLSTVYNDDWMKENKFL